MKRSRSVVAALLLAAAAGSSARADDAAATYRAAFALMPRDQVSGKGMEHWSDPVDAATAAMVEQCDPALNGMHAAAKESFNGWSRDISAGIATPIPEWMAAPRLSEAAGAKIRILCNDKKYDQAAALVLDTVTMGRRIATDKAVTGRFVGLGIERVVMAAIAESVPAMPAAVARKLANDYARLPAAGPIADCVNGDKEMTEITLKKPGGQDDPLHGLAPDDEAGRAAVLKETDQLYSKLAEIVALPPDKVGAGLKEYDQLAAGMSQPANKILPKPDKLIASLQRGAEMESLFVAGLYVASDGPLTLTTGHDTLTGRPFEYKKSADGFELRSAMKLGGKDVRIEFGPGALK